MNRALDWLQRQINGSELATAFRKQFIFEAVNKIAEEIELPELTTDHDELARAVLYFETISVLRRWAGVLAGDHALLGRASSTFGTAQAFAFAANQISERLWVAATRINTGVILTAAMICSVPSDTLRERGFTIPNVPKCDKCSHDLSLHRCTMKTAESQTHACVLCKCDVTIPIVQNGEGVTTEVTPVQ